MLATILSKLRTAALLLTASAMLLSSTACDIIIINDVYTNNMSNNDVEKNNSTEATFTPTEYTPYEKSEDNKAISDGYLSALPKRDYDGAVFFITTPSTSYIDPDAADNNVTRMLRERNLAIEEKYNISILTSVRDAGTMLTEMEQAVASDSYYTDLMMVPLYMTGQFRMADVLMNLRSMPFLDLDAPYFNRESVSMTSAGYQTYGVAGHATISPDAFTAVYFNRDLTTEAGLTLPYADVVTKEWTWDTFFTYTAAVAALNGENGTTLSTVTVQNNTSRLADLIFVSCGNQYIKAEKRNTPKLAFTAEDAAYAVATANKILTDPAAVADASANLIDSFGEGNALFLVEYLSAMPRLTDAAANWGILPLPTEETGDSYRTLLANTELIFTVPVNHTKPEIASIVLSALNAGSYGYIYDEFVSYSMANVLRDNDSVNMLELILDTGAFDFALAFGNSYPEVAAGTYGLIRDAALNDNLAERYDEAEAAMMRALLRDFGFKQ